MEEVAQSARSDERCPRCGAAVTDADDRCGACERPLVAPAELPAGAPLNQGRYEVLATIGRGGFGITYEAGDTRLQRRVAIKELFPDTAVRHGSQVLTPADARDAFRAARERFLREARVLARFTHPGVVRVYEVFEEHGTAYLVMELLGGTTLVDVLRARGEPFEEAEVLDVAGRVAAALRPVHAAGVLHRDLNPSNVMLTEHGRIVLIDFGLARDFDQDRTMGMTRVVTPGYAPLEQYRGEARFGPSTDVYGLAATLYRLATGKVPTASVARDAGAVLEPVHRANPAISKAVGDAIGDGLELEPAHRPQDLDALLARLGIRHLPDGPRSVLLGTPGAELDRLRAASPAPVPGRPPGPSPASATDAVERDPSPRPAPDPARSPDASAEWVASPPSPLPAAGGAVAADPDQTEHVALAELLAAARRPGDEPMAPAPPAGADADATRPGATPRAAEPDPDRTRSAGARAAGPIPAPADATRPATSAPAATALLAGDGGAGVAAPAVPGSLGVLGRRKVTIPLAALGIAAAAAAPVLAVAAIVLVALPVLATLGDLSVRRLRTEHGFAEGWLEARAPGGAFVAVRFVRNALASVVRASPILGLGAVLLGMWYLVEGTSVPVGVTDALLRIVGAGTAAAILAASGSGTNRFRTGFGVDRLVAWLVPDGRTNQRIVVAWLVVAILVAAALWLDPDPFPLP